MSGLLVVANDVIGERMAGPGIRAWEIARALHAAGVRVVLAAPGRAPPPAPFPSLAFDTRGDALRAAAEAADALFVQGLVLAHYPFLAALPKPIAVDVYDPFVLENLAQREGESAAHRAQHHAKDLDVLSAQLLRGDFFVCASEPQRDFWLGMLSALNRVNPATYADDPSLRRLVDLLPFGLPEEPPRAGKPVLKGVVPGIGAGDQVVLWGGGIWNWFDPLTLIRALARLAPERPGLRLFFMGTRTPSLYAPKQAMALRAESLARELGLLDRAVFFNPGWVPYAERAGYLLEADIGASCHLPHVEARLAFRTRLLDCIWAGLPMLVSEGDVLADRVRERDLGRAVPPEDVAALARGLADLLDRPGGRAAYAPRFEALRAELSWGRAVEALARFAADPYRAADMPSLGLDPARLAPTPASALPRRALEVLREGGPLLLAEEGLRYLRWRRRPH